MTTPTWVDTDIVTNTRTCTVPTHIDGDLLVICINEAANNVAGGDMLPVGWTPIGSTMYLPGTNSGNVQFGYRIADSEPADYTVGQGSGSSLPFDYSVCITAFRGDGEPPIDAAVQSNAASTTVQAPSVTGDEADMLLVFWGAARSVTSITPPSGMTDVGGGGGTGVGATQGIAVLNWDNQEGVPSGTRDGTIGQTRVSAGLGLIVGGIPTEPIIGSWSWSGVT